MLRREWMKLGEEDEISILWVVRLVLRGLLWLRTIVYSSWSEVKTLHHCSQALTFHDHWQTQMMYDDTKRDYSTETE